VLSKSSFHKLSNQCDWQRTIRWKTDCPFAGAVTLEFVFMDFDGKCAWIERAVLRARPEGHKQIPVQPECGDTITDALFRFGYCRVNGPSELFERRALVGAHVCKEFVDGVCCHERFSRSPETDVITVLYA